MNQPLAKFLTSCFINWYKSQKTSAKIDKGALWRNASKKHVTGDHMTSKMADDDVQIIGSDETENDEKEEELSGCGATAACDPRRPYHRYIVLVFMCFLSFGSYFCYDNPGAIQDIIKRDMKVDSGRYMTLYALYSWPNVILCFFGGFLIDRVFGIRWGAIIFSVLVTAGQIVFAMGAFINVFEVMQVGRFIFGLGGESLAVAQNTYAVNWFKEKELNMVFGLQLSFSRVGSTVNFMVMEDLYNWLNQWFEGYINLGVSLLVAGIFCILSLIVAFALAFFDKRAKRILKTKEAATGEVIRLRDIKDFPAQFWLLAIICVAYYVTIFPFIGLGLVFFEMKFGYSPQAADSVNSVVYILSAVASPLFGFFIDKSGKNIFWVITGVVVTLGCHATLAFTFLNPYVAMVTMGFAYSVLASALWPMVAMVVPEYQLGTAYGIMQSVQNLGLALVAQVAGQLVDLKGYLMYEVFNLMWLCLALLVAVILYLTDAVRGGHLNRSAKERAKLAAIEKASVKPVEDIADDDVPPLVM